MCAASQTDGASAYLSRIGPAPLRFSLVTATFSFTLPAILIPRPAATNSTEIPVSDTNNIQSNLSGYQPATVPESTNALPTAYGPDAPKNSAQGPSASDLLVISPQMLTEYFKPGSDGTNSATTLPASVGFTPPLVKPSSQATYRSP